MSLFLGYTKEQALQFFDDLVEFRQGNRTYAVGNLIKPDFTEKIYHFKGENTHNTLHEDKVYIRSMKTDITEKYFLFRPYYTDKSYVAEKTVKLYQEALSNYRETASKAPCASNDPAKMMDMDDECHYERLITRTLGFGTELNEFDVYVADNPQYEDERFFAIDWFYRNTEVLPLGESPEDAYRQIKDFENALRYAYDNKLGWYKKIKFIYKKDDPKNPGETMRIGDLFYFVLGYTQIKSVTLIPYRYGCRGLTVNMTTLGEMRKGIDRYVERHGNK